VSPSDRRLEEREHSVSNWMPTSPCHWRDSPEGLAIRHLASDLRKFRDEQGHYLRERHGALCGTLLNPRTIYRRVASRFFIRKRSMTKNLLLGSIAENFLPVEDRQRCAKPARFAQGTSGGLSLANDSGCPVTADTSSAIWETTRCWHAEARFCDSHHVVSEAGPSAPDRRARGLCSTITARS
jgi:hypothetical protein